MIAFSIGRRDGCAVKAVAGHQVVDVVVGVGIVADYEIAEPGLFSGQAHAAGIPLSVFAEAANVNDMCLVGANLMELDDLPVKRPSPRRLAQGMCLDKDYDYPEIRHLVSL